MVQQPQSERSCCNTCYLTYTCLKECWGRQQEIRDANLGTQGRAGQGRLRQDLGARTGLDRGSWFRPGHQPSPRSAVSWAGAPSPAHPGPLRFRSSPPCARHVQSPGCHSLIRSSGLPLASWRRLLPQAVAWASGFSLPLSCTDLAAFPSLQTGRLPVEKEMLEGPGTGTGQQETGVEGSCGPSVDLGVSADKGRVDEEG